MPELRDLPAIEKLLQSPALAPLVHAHGAESIKGRLRMLQGEMRQQRAVPEWATEAEGYVDAIGQALPKTDYVPVFNLTGTIIHTNLGRALLSQELWDDIAPLITRPMNLEYDLVKGARGQRDTVVEERLCELMGCEAVTIVNNNAAALMLVLNTFGLNAEVAVSRGELVEIGGSFRLPELMHRAGCRLLEVGTTNRTRIADFAEVASQAAMLLKVHPSNYHMEGFTESVSAGELGALGAEHNVPSWQRSRQGLMGRIAGQLRRLIRRRCHTHAALVQAPPPMRAANVLACCHGPRSDPRPRCGGPAPSRRKQDTSLVAARYDLFSLILLGR